MKSLIGLLVVSLSILLGIGLIPFHIPSTIAARAGQLDLRTRSLSSKSIIPLEGQWVFYPNELLTPRDLTGPLGRNKKYIQVPHVWGQGYGTYELEVQISPRERQFLNAMYLPSISSAYRVWVNETEVRASGLIGTTRSAMRPKDDPGVVALPDNRSTHLDIVIDVSNFVQSKGGVGESPLLGNLQSLIRFHDKNLFLELFIVGSLFITGLYYISFYLGIPTERFTLYYALLCGDVALQSFFLDSSNIMAIVPMLGWILETKLEYLSGSIGLILVIMVTKALYPRDSRFVPNLIFIVLGGLFSVIFLITPPWIFTSTIDAFGLSVTFAVCYMLVVFMRAIKMGRDNAIANFISLLFFAAAIVNDILYYANVIQSQNLVPEGLFMFVLVQTITFSRKHAHTLVELELRTNDLITVNEELELKIQGRTRELKDAMDNLQESNARLEQLLMRDSVTTIPNRRYFELTTKQMWLELEDNHSEMTILIIDVDFFKQYNDCYGHMQGDICLREVATTLEIHLMSYLGAFVARIGGEEFAAVIPHSETVSVSELAESLRQLIMNLKILHAGSEINRFVTVSIGGVRANANSSVDVLDLMIKADDALYQAKRGGRNRTFTFDWEVPVSMETVEGRDSMTSLTE